MRLLH